MSVCSRHSGYADHHVESAYNSIEKNHKIDEKTCKLWEETSTLNLVPVLELNREAARPHLVEQKILQMQ